MNAEHKTEITNRYPVIADIIAGMPAKIWAECRIVNLQKGEVLFEWGDNVTHVYILCSGTVVVSSQAKSGNEMRVVFVKEGNAIGEMEALASEMNMVYNARAYNSCQMILLPVKSFLEWIDADPSICRMMLGAMAKKLHIAANEVSEYTQYDAIVRISTLIYSEDCGRMAMTRRELAETCAVSVRTINRCLQRLKSEKLIGIKRGKIFVTPEQKELLSKSPYNFYNFQH
jgi:CRP/FNR family transcriptional regulator, cyclic AMP receptor protein